MPEDQRKGRRLGRSVVAAIVVGAVVLYGLSLLAGPAETRPAADHALPNLPPRLARTQPAVRLMHLTAVLAGRGARVYCWSSADWDRRVHWSGWRAYTVERPAVTVNLPPNVCSELEQLGNRRVPVSKIAFPDAVAWSLETLAHEAVHVSGIRSEVKAECYGMQLVPTAAVELGRTRAEGRYLARLYWRHWYPRIEARYRSSECRKGGRLDLRPGSAAWP